MNLFDLANRKDRSFQIAAGRVEATRTIFAGIPYLGLQFFANSEVVLRDAHDFYPLKIQPEYVGWLLARPSFRLSSQFSIYLKPIGTEESVALYSANLKLGKRSERVTFAWPQDLKGPFDLVLTNKSKHDIFLFSSRQFNARKNLIPLLRGNGIEVGAGLNPCILPSSDVNVHYLETLTFDEWIALYRKQDKTLPTQLEALKDRYRIGNAHYLENTKDQSLDFIFSNHVLEHLMNPLGVLRNWLTKLRPGGVIAGVIPDCRYTFDIRQTPSTFSEWEDEFENNSFTPSLHHYERWCKLTQPKNSPDDLIRRNYSIHMHYYTPDSFSALTNLLQTSGEITNVGFNVSENNKDFGFSFNKPC